MSKEGKPWVALVFSFALSPKNMLIFEYVSTGRNGRRVSRQRMISKKVEERKNLKQNPMISEWSLLISGCRVWAVAGVQDSFTHTGFSQPICQARRAENLSPILNIKWKDGETGSEVG